MLFAGTVRAALLAADTFAWASFNTVDMTQVAASNERGRRRRGRGKAAAAPPAMRLVSATPGSGTGLMAQYYGQIDESELAQTIVDPYIDNVWTGTGPRTRSWSGQNDNVSVIWTGYIEAPVTGTYTIFGATDDGMRIHVSGTAVIDALFFQGPTEYAGTIDLVAGQRYPIKIRYFQGGGLTEAHVWWQTPGGIKEVIPAERLYPYLIDGRPPGGGFGAIRFPCRAAARAPRRWRTACTSATRGMSRASPRSSPRSRSVAGFVASGWCSIVDPTARSQRWRTSVLTAARRSRLGLFAMASSSAAIMAWLGARRQMHEHAGSTGPCLPVLVPSRHRTLRLRVGVAG